MRPQNPLFLCFYIKINTGQFKIILSVYLYCLFELLEFFQWFNLILLCKFQKVGNLELKHNKKELPNRQTPFCVKK
nr:MAG TPA: hypothetical protein [Caudoviricetes sp.]DAM43702.1 MAG TPA: hypothetical protein [Caudoviricetes sp.]